MLGLLRRVLRRLTRGDQIDSLRQQVVELRSGAKTANAEHAARRAVLEAQIERLASIVDQYNPLLSQLEARLSARIADYQYRQRYLLSEAAQTHRLLRALTVESPAFRQSIEQTAGSFDEQWEQLPDGESLLTNAEFDAGVCDLVTRYTQLPADWFAGKRVLDAGCGNGRFSVAMAQLGAEVTAFDQSAHGVEAVRNVARARNLNVDVHQLNVLQPLPFEPDFDLVWSYGVLHHTGDTYRAFGHVQSLVRDDGYLFLMLYGEPRWDKLGDFIELYDYERLRRAIANRTFDEKIAILENDDAVSDVHGWFDAVSPSINDLYTFEEIEGWLLQAGFADVARTADNRNHHVIARKPAGDRPAERTETRKAESDAGALQTASV